MSLLNSFANLISKNIQYGSANIYIITILYSIITILSNSETDIFIVNADVKLPLLHVSIPLFLFSLIVPIIIIFLYIRFQINILQIRENNGDLSEKLKEFCLLSLLINPYYGRYILLKRIVSILILWISLPLSILIICYKGLKLHDPIISYYIIFIFFLSIFITLFFLYKNKSRKYTHFVFILNSNYSSITAFLILFIFFTVFILIPNLNSGPNSRISDDLIEKLSKNFTLDFSYKNLGDLDNLEKKVYFPDFNGSRLQGANFHTTTAIKADFRNSSLQNTIFQDAILNESKFEYSNLSNAKLFNAEIHNAKFNSANLTGAVFTNTDLRNSDFSNSKLQDSYFTNSDMRGVKNISIDELCKVSSAYNAKFDVHILNEIKKNCDNVLAPEKHYLKGIIGKNKWFIFAPKYTYVSIPNSKYAVFQIFEKKNNFKMSMGKATSIEGKIFCLISLMIKNNQHIDKILQISKNKDVELIIQDSEYKHLSKEYLQFNDILISKSEINNINNYCNQN